MDTLAVPNSGLALTGIYPSKSPDGPAKPENKPSQVIQLHLPQGMLRDFLKDAKNGSKAMHISMGKVVVCDHHLVREVLLIDFGHCRRCIMATNHNSYRVPHKLPGVSCTAMFQISQMN